MKFVKLLLLPILFVFGPAGAEALWTGTVRGSWVQTGAKAADDITLSTQSTVAPIIIENAEKGPVKRAAQTLAGDIEKITGRRPEIAATIPAGAKSAIIIGTVDTSTLLTSMNARGTLSLSGLRGKWEAFTVKTVSSPLAGIDEAVVIAGSNMRGTIFGIYALSERLGTDPFVYFTGREPKQYPDGLVVKAGSLEEGEPTFYFRGLFLNDLDLIVGAFKNVDYGRVPLDWYKHLAETSLRIRMNMIAPEALIVKHAEEFDVFREYGLIVTSHHYDALISTPDQFISNPLNRPELEGLKYDYINNREELVEFWGTGVDITMENECVYPVCLRNVRDRGYRFPDGYTDAQKGALITRAIDDQIAVAKQKRGNNDPDMFFHHTMYGKQLQDLYTNGHVSIPDEVILTWCDDNCGRFYYPETFSTNHHHGVYYHVAYFGGVCKQQFYTATRLDRIESNYRDAVGKGLTRYMLLNCSELMTYIPEVKFVADISWNAAGAFGGQNAAGRYIDWFAREQFPVQNATDNEIKRIVDSYYAAIGNPVFPSDWIWNFLTPLRENTGYTTAQLEGKRNEMRGNADRLGSIYADAVAVREKLAPQDARIFYEFFIFPCDFNARQYRAGFHLCNSLLAADKTGEYNHLALLAAQLDTIYDAVDYVQREPFGKWVAGNWARQPLRSMDYLYWYIAEKNVTAVPNGMNVYASDDSIFCNALSGSTANAVFTVSSDISQHENVRLAFQGQWIWKDEMAFVVNGKTQYGIPSPDGIDWDNTSSTHSNVFRVDIDGADVVRGENTITFKTLYAVEQTLFGGIDNAGKAKQFNNARLEFRSAGPYRWTSGSGEQPTVTEPHPLFPRHFAPRIETTVFDAMGRRVRRTVDYGCAASGRPLSDRHAQGRYVIKIRTGGNDVRYRASTALR